MGDGEMGLNIEVCDFAANLRTLNSDTQKINNKL